MTSSSTTPDHLTLELQLIDVSLLDPHPQNPRLFLREDVIEGIANLIRARGSFDPDHAPLVRPRPNGRPAAAAG